MSQFGELVSGRRQVPADVDGRLHGRDYNLRVAVTRSPDQHLVTTTVAGLPAGPSSVFTCIGALGTPPPSSRTGPLARKYRVSLTVDLCGGNKIISLKKFISPQPVGGPSNRKKIRGPWARAQCAHWLRRPWRSRGASPCRPWA